MSNQESGNQEETKSEIQVEDLPVDEASDDDVKGGSQSQNNLKQLGIGLL